MILTCPRCATRYLLDERLVWANGRTVRCEACGEAWRAFGTGVRSLPTAPEALPDGASTALQGDLSAPLPSGDANSVKGPLAGGPAPAPPPTAETVHPVSLPLAPGDPPPSGDGPPTAAMFPAARVAPKRRASSLSIFWLMICLLLATALVASIAFREDVIREFPGLAGAYSALGLHTASSGKADGPVPRSAPVKTAAPHA